MIKIGQINNYWQLEYDTSIVSLELFFDDENGGNLLIDINKKHIKSGIGKGTYETHIGKFDVGTIKKPNKILIQSLLSKHKQLKSFSKSGWFSNERSNMTLNELINVFINEQNFILRSIKIKELKNKISSK